MQILLHLEKSKVEEDAQMKQDLDEVTGLPMEQDMKHWLSFITLPP